jgi:hypothetical protein
MSMMRGTMTPEAVTFRSIVSSVSDLPPPVSPETWMWRAPCFGSYAWTIAGDQSARTACCHEPVATSNVDPS